MKLLDIHVVAKPLGWRHHLARARWVRINVGKPLDSKNWDSRERSINAYLHLRLSTFLDSSSGRSCLLEHLLLGCGSMLEHARPSLVQRRLWLLGNSFEVCCKKVGMGHHHVLDKGHHCARMCCAQSRLNCKRRRTVVLTKLSKVKQHPRSHYQNKLVKMKPNFTGRPEHLQIKRCELAWLLSSKRVFSIKLALSGEWEWSSAIVTRFLEHLRTC